MSKPVDAPQTTSPPLSEPLPALTPLTAENADKVKLLRTLDGHTDVVLRVVFSSDGKLIASIS